MISLLLWIQSSRQNSRNSSPQNNPNSAHQSSLMTGSLNLPSGAALPGSALYQRRKNYDPIRAVEIDRQKSLAGSKQTRSAHLPSSASRNSIGSAAENERSNIEYDSMSETSSFSMSMQHNSSSQYNNSNNNKQVSLTHSLTLYT